MSWTNRSSTRYAEVWYARQDLNLRPLPPQGSALSPELRARNFGCQLAVHQFSVRTNRSNWQLTNRQPPFWRRDGDSNPEGLSAVPVFETGSLPFGHPSAPSIVRAG